MRSGSFRRKDKEAVTMKIGGKHYRLTKNRKTLLLNLLMGAGLAALTGWCLFETWEAFLYGPIW